MIVNEMLRVQIPTLLHGKWVKEDRSFIALCLILVIFEFWFWKVR